MTSLIRISRFNLVNLCLALMVWSAMISQTRGSDDTYPANEYEYSVRREWLLEAESNFGSHTKQILSEDEDVVDHYLHYLKWKEHQATKVSGFPPARPIEEKLQEIQRSEIYQALKKLPKGGVMHSHENHQLGKSKLFDIVWESEDFQYLYLGNPNHPETAWKLDFFAIEPPVEGTIVPWLRANESGYTKEEILQHNTLIGLLTFNDTRYPTDSNARWRRIDPLWESMGGNLVNNVNIKLKYIQAMYDHGLDEGVQYYETRKSFGPGERMYRLESAPQYQSTLGKVYLGETWQESSDMDVEMTIELATNMTSSSSEFIGHKRISYTYRRNLEEVWRQDMENVARLYSKYPDHVVGFDTVGEEDAGYSHLHYLQNFLTLYNEQTRQSRVPLFLHLVETSWPEDLISSNLQDDPVGTLNNAYEVLLLGAKRLGHATGLVKHPYLLDVVRQRNLAIEVCLVSNQILGFMPDLRNQPGLHYYRSGIPIVFGPDDPGTFGYDNFTVDWYEAYMAWGINLADLKQIAFNSLNYSAMTDAEKNFAIEERWRPMWNRYITGMKEEACSRDYISENQDEPSFARILPREGARMAGTRVHVFGRNFERAICKEIKCRFDELESIDAIYLTNEHIICVAPDSGLAAGSSRTVDLSIRLDGTKYIPTNFNYTFKYDILTTTVPPNGASKGHNFMSHLLVIPLMLALH